MSTADEMIIELQDKITSLEQELKLARQQVVSLDNKLYRVMLDYCPDQITQEQTNNWGKDQKLVVFDPYLSGYKKINSHEELLDEHYYWARAKKDKGGFFIATVKSVPGDNNGKKMSALIISNMCFWIYEGQNQALQSFDIYGHIPEPFNTKVIPCSDLCSVRGIGLLD